MALPAGRYGVTKKQLNKIKNLPMNTIEMIEEAKEGIAIIEDGEKASQLVTAGTQFWHNGKLYSADVDIAKDANIVTSGEGKNATEMSNITVQLATVDASKADITVISGNVENGATASKAYAVGEHFMRNGKFATAIAAIAIDDTLTENTNYSVGDVGSLLTVVSENATPAQAAVTISTGYEKVYKQGRVVYFSIRFILAEASTTDSFSLINLPWIPLGGASISPHFPVVNRTAPYETVCNCFIGVTGVIKINGVALAAGTYEVNGTYIS